MVNRQDALCSPGSPAIGRPLLAAKINFDGTKLPMVAEPSQTTTHGTKLLFSLISDRSESRQSKSNLRGGTPHGGRHCTSPRKKLCVVWIGLRRWRDPPDAPCQCRAPG